MRHINCLCMKRLIFCYKLLQDMFMFSHKMGTRISTPGVKMAAGLSLAHVCRFCKSLGAWNINSTAHQTPICSTHHWTEAKLPVY